MSITGISDKIILFAVVITMQMYIFISISSNIFIFCLELMNTTIQKHNMIHAQTALVEAHAGRSQYAKPHDSQQGIERNTATFIFVLIIVVAVYVIIRVRKELKKGR
jgi:hypothetical protein